MSRTTGLPGFDESGEWEPAELASLVVEVGFALLAAASLAGGRTRRTVQTRSA